MLLSPSGVAGVLRIAATSVIPLDTAGNGKAMPLAAGQIIPLTADISPTIAAGLASPVLNGVCVADYVSSGTGALNLSSSFLTRGDTYAAEAARMFTVTYFVQTSGTYAVVQKGSLSATFPFFTAQSPPAGTNGTAYSYTYLAPNATSFALFSGALPAGIALNTVTGVVSGTPTTLATSTYLISATSLGGTSLSLAQSVVISAVLTTPGQVTSLTLGIPTSTSQPLSWVAPASSGTSAITDYFIEYKATSSGTWLAFAHTASTTTTVTITGLTASTSYDSRVSAINASGTGTASTVATGSTTSPASIVVSTVAQTADNLTALGYLDYQSFSSSGSADIRKAAANLIVGLTFTNLTRTAGGGSLSPTYNWTDATPTATGSTTETGAWNLTSTAADGSIDFSVPAGVGTKRLRILVGLFTDTGRNSTTQLSFTLSDGSFATQTVSPPKTSGSFITTYYEVAYNAAAATQTLNIKFKELSAGIVGIGSGMCIRVMTYGN